MTWFDELDEAWIANNDEGNPPINDAVDYGVKITPDDSEPGEPKFQVLGVHHLTGAENGGNHNLYVTVIDEFNARLMGQEIALTRNPAPNSPIDFMVTEKPPSEPAANTPMHQHDTIKTWVMKRGLPPDIQAPSDQVSGLHIRHNDEGPGNTWGHHSFYVLFKRLVSGESPPDPPDPPDPETVVFTATTTIRRNGKVIKQEMIRWEESCQGDE